jgi:8-oxo-dGTP pyrophosphatase MutT (NUDIX family)
VIEAHILNRLADRLAAALAPPSVPLHRFVVDGIDAGELDAPRAERLRAWPDVFVVDEREVRLVPTLVGVDACTAALDRVVGQLASEGALTAWRDERYAVAGAFGATPLFHLERAAARYFGIPTYAVHVNGTTTVGGREAMWIARRSPDKAIDPGLLDNMIGGGIAAGSSVRETLVKEAWEEAGLDAATATLARAAGSVRIRRLQPDGVQRETLFVHDLHLPRDVVPRNQDGEVVEFRLASPEEAAWIAGTAEGSEAATADAALVMAEWLVRQGYISRRSGVGRVVEASG